jgi:hypothetical protein
MRLARWSRPGHMHRVKSIILVLWLVASLFAVSATALSSDLVDHMQAKLESFVKRERALAFLALYWVPESQPGFMAVVGEVTWWHIADVQEFEDMLSRHQQREVLKEVAGRLARLPADERESYFRRLDRWVISYNQLDLMEGFVSHDLLLEGIISLPATRPVYDSIVTSRGLDPSQVTPEWIVETMASAERTQTWYEGLTVLSSFGDAQLMLYFRDLYTKLGELATSGAGND